MSMEDGPASQDRSQVNSQLYMYVGEKDRSRGATVLERNGLVGGTLYVFRSKDLARNSESTFLNGSIDGEWVSLGNVSALTDVQLEAASDAVNAMIFARPEDGAFNPNEDDEYFFVTTGEGTGNALGRLYSLELSGKDSTGPAKLTVEYNADQVIAAGGDIAVSPDNIDTSRDYLMINEDGTATSRAVMAAKKRDGSIWRFDLDKNGVDVSSAPPHRRAQPARPRPATARSAPASGRRAASSTRRSCLRRRHLALRRAGAPADYGAEAEHRRGRSAADARRARRQGQATTRTTTTTSR